VDVFRLALPSGMAAGFNPRPSMDGGGGGGNPASAARSRMINAMLVKLAER
jgi:hypothetical protein